MMQHYLRINADHRNTLMFYRMGGFYEPFFDDARKAARLLDTTLTSKGHFAGQAIPGNSDRQFQQATVTQAQGLVALQVFFKVLSR